MTSPSVDDIAALQKELGDKISRILINFKKDSEDRKTSEYLHKRLEDLERLWISFKNNHIILEEYADQQAEHPYYTTNYFASVATAYESAKILMEDKLKKIFESKGAKPKTAREHQTPPETQKDSPLQLPAASVAASSAMKQIPEQKEREGNLTELSNTIYLLRKQEAAIQMIKDSIKKMKSDQQDKNYYQRKMQDLSKSWNLIQGNHMEIFAVATGNNECGKYLNSKVYSDLEDLYERAMLQLQAAFCKANSAESQDSQIQPQKLTLPPLQLPQFSGDYQNWKGFQDLFIELIHNNNNLGNAQKMHYLKSNLMGEARKIIQHLKVMDENYVIAWNLLNTRYNNQRLLVSTQIQKLLTQPSCQFESASSLKRLHDVSQECLLTLKNLGVKTDNWDPFVTYILTQKLDKDSHKHYEERLKNPKEIPTINEFFGFLEYRFQALEAVGEKGRKENPPQKISKGGIHTINLLQSSNHPKGKITRSCSICKGNHGIFSCNIFLAMNAQERTNAVKAHKLCLNCLQSNHNLEACNSKKTCKTCHKRHNTLLHTEIKTTDTKLISHLSSSSVVKSQVMLATAMITVSSYDGSAVKLRALIDQGSQATIISEKAVQLLKLKRTKVVVQVNGVGENKSSTARSCVQICIKPQFTSDFKLTTVALVLNKLTKMIPMNPIELSHWPQIKNIVLADPQFNQPGKIDIILGADVMSEILLPGLLKGPSGSPVAQQTELGWILSGKISAGIQATNITCAVIEIQEQLEKFWNIEELPEERALSNDDQLCQEFFKRTVTRTEEGRYVVKLPFNDKINNHPLGESRNKAVARLLGMELKFKKSKELESEYKTFMDEYSRLGHMKLRHTTIRESEEYYLPHHAVLKEDSTTTKLRVVFDASARSSSGISLNEKLLTGPVLQQDLFNILIRWRKHRIAYKADIEKMYRQIQIAEDDQKYQLILWRNSPQESIKEYQLTTVTYGVRSAPYLAVRTLLQLAEDEKHNYPIASQIAHKDFYVDDLISGADTVKEAKEAQTQLIQMLSSAGFKLRKWASHCTDILEDLPPDAIESDPYQFDDSNREYIKTLGIQWNPKTDSFSFKLQLSSKIGIPTKRCILSEASRIFDPLGFLTPITITAKVMLQELWIGGLNWDEPLSEQLTKRWTNYKNDLTTIDDLRIPRWICYSKSFTFTEIHAFCDASEKAYAAVAYLKTIDHSKKVNITLIGAKSKVAPIGKRLSLPRLELCAALLLVRLVIKIKEAMELENVATYAWTDSSVTLSWIKGDINKWKTFVANRVAVIQAAIHPDQWNHVKSNQNPADVATRGTNAKLLATHPLWWSGPQWLQRQELYTPKETLIETTLEARKVKTTHIIHNQLTFLTELTTKYSTLSKLINVISYCRRFIMNAKASIQGRTDRKLSNGGYKKRSIKPLTPEEVHKSTNILIRGIQQEEFPEETRRILKNKPLKRNSKILSLQPFFDDEQILRVGGRLKNSNLPFEQRHQIIIPYNHPLTSLIIQDAHRKTLHGGEQLTLAYIRQRYWILKGQRAVKKHLHKCIICCRQNAKTSDQLMGDLPKVRTTIARPFTNVGVDYAGPLHLRLSKGRGVKTQKGYIVVFVCLSTKAMHLEVATDLSAEAFIAAFRRMVGRRGLVQNIYSDNASNFILANKILELDAKTFKETYQHRIFIESTNLGTTWHFIPPSAPNFGGLWEAGVKSVKQHLKRILTDTRLTFEELSTLLVQIEACLNSRPLCPLSSDPQEVDVLTPGHFLIGAPLLAPPQRDLITEKLSLQTRWQLIQKLHQDFWKKWSEEYITRLQERPKWLRKVANLEPGQIVIIRDEKLPPNRWALAKIIDIHPGPDGLVRVATLKTQNGTIKRAVSKLCLLPVDNNKESIEHKPCSPLANQAADNAPTQQSKSKQKLLRKTQSEPEQHMEAKKQQKTLLPEVVSGQAKGAENKAKINYDTLLSKSYGVGKAKRRRLKIVPPTTYSNLISKEKQEETVNQLRMRYPETIAQIEQKRKKLSFIDKPNMKETRFNLKDEHPSSKRKTHHKTPAVSNIVLMLCLALLIMPIIAVNQNSVEIIPFRDNPGLYFEERGHVNIINSQWNIIAFYNISNYITEMEGLKEAMISLEGLCNLIKIRKQYCTEILHQFQHQLRQLEEGHQLLNQLNGNLSTRKRRSPLDIVGTIANKLFGILDAEYADKVNLDIEKARENENHLLSLVKNQTSLIESTINIVKKQDTAIEIQFQMIKNHLTSLKQIIEKTGSALKEEQTAHLIASLSTHTMLVIHNCQRVQDMILDVLTDLRHGKVNPLIVTPLQLKKQIAFIKEHLPRTLRLPEGRQNQLLLIYSLMTIRGRVLPSRILFQIHIPLLLNKEFQLFKLIPIPTQHKGAFIFIEPSTSYLAIGEHREYYFPMSFREINNCRYIDTDKYLCQQQQPIFNHESNISQCEIELLNHKRELSSSCKISTVSSPNTWIQLHAANSWIYALDQEYTFSIICGSLISPQTISGSGILRLRPDCLLKQPSMIIYGHGLYESRFNASFLPKTNLSQVVLNNMGNSARSKNFRESQFNSTKEDLQSLLKELERLKQQEAFPQHITSHDIHQFSIIYLILMALVLIGASYFIRKIYHKLCGHRRQPTAEIPSRGPIPAKRRKLTEEDFCVVTSTP